MGAVGDGAAIRRTLSQPCSATRSAATWSICSEASIPMMRPGGADLVLQQRQAQSGAAAHVQHGVAAADGQLLDEQFAPLPEGVGAPVVATGLAAVGLAATRPGELGTRGARARRGGSGRTAVMPCAVAGWPWMDPSARSRGDRGRGELGAAAWCSVSQSPRTAANRSGCSTWGRCPQSGNIDSRPSGSRFTAAWAWWAGRT